LLRYLCENNTFLDMEKIYAKKQNKCALIEAQPQTVQFLLNYSKSLKVTKAKGIQFETNLN